MDMKITVCSTDFEELTLPDGAVMHGGCEPLFVPLPRDLARDESARLLEGHAHPVLEGHAHPDLEIRSSNQSVQRVEGQRT
jgi:hypothetical protein